MTCIAAVREGKRIVMGGDAAGVAGYSLYNRADNKVFIKQNMIFGFTSSFRMGNLLRWQLEIPKHPLGMSVLEYMNVPFIESVRGLLKEKGFSTTKDNQEEGGTFLVGYKGKLFRVEDDFQVALHRDKFLACGCGESFALATLYTLRDKKIPAKQKITQALVTAEYFSAAVRKPFVILEL